MPQKWIRPTMSDTLTRPETDLDAMFALSVPCNSCGQPAKFRSLGHVVNDCGAIGNDPPPPYHKCLRCFLAWRDHVVNDIREQGCVCCAGCRVDFYSPDTFSNYREF